MGEVRQIGHDDRFGDGLAHVLQDESQVLLKGLGIIAVHQVICTGPEGDKIGFRPDLQDNPDLLFDEINTSPGHSKIDQGHARHALVEVTLNEVDIALC